MWQESDNEKTLRASAISLRRWLELATVILCAILFVVAFEFSYANNVVAQQNPPQGESKIKVDPNADFTRFKHSNPIHSQLPCLLCHVRNTNAPKPKRTGHLPCAGCHSAQFADTSHPICTICHTNPQTGGIKRFPPLRSFGAKFSHATHIRRANCATCHQPSRRGVAFSIPARSAAHTTCYKCHTSNAPRSLSSCGVCHQSGGRITASESTVAYRKSFSHAKHKATNQCAACHSLQARAPRGKEMSAPLVAMHFARKGVASCGNCHDNKRAFGPPDFASCKRCHRDNVFSF